MRPIIRDGKTYSHQTVYWSNGRFYWYGSNEQLTDIEVQHFRRFQNQPPRVSEVAAAFMQRHGAVRTLPKTRSEELQNAMWDLEQAQFDAEEDAREGRA